MSKSEVVRFTFGDMDVEKARHDLHNYHYDPITGEFKITYRGPPIPQGAVVQVPHMITELLTYIGQGINFDVVVYSVAENPDRYEIDITQIWR